MAAASLLDVVGITKNFDGHAVLRNLSFRLNEGEILAIAGESGAGKSTLFSILCGFESFDAGSINLCGRDITRWPSYQRNIAIVLQEFSLFPHMTVRANLEFGLARRRNPGNHKRADLETLAQQCGIYRHLQRYPDTLSGGEKQRVALLRAVLSSPDLILLDEPLGSLDAKTKRELLPTIRTVLKESARGALYVSHDPGELFFIADRMAVLHEGNFVQEGTAESLYAQPKHEYVARFVEGGNLISADAILSRLPKTDSGVDVACSCAASLTLGTQVVIRPEHVSHNSHDGWLHLGDALVTQCTYVGGRYRVKLQLTEDQEAYYYTDDNCVIGRSVPLYINPKGIVHLER